MNEAELARDLHAVLLKVQQGVDVVIEQDRRPIAVLKSSGTERAGRMLSEVLADLKGRRSAATMDEEFARDIEAGIEATRKPWKPMSWD